MVDYQAIGQKLLAQAEANARRLADHAEAEAERMLALNRPLWREQDLPGDLPAEAIADMLRANPELRKQVMDLLDTP